jgi:hypothetical protein
MARQKEWIPGTVTENEEKDGGCCLTIKFDNDSVGYYFVPDDYLDLRPIGDRRSCEQRQVNVGDGPAVLSCAFEPYDDWREYAPGRLVEANYDDKWYLGIVVEVRLSIAGKARSLSLTVRFAKDGSCDFFELPANRDELRPVFYYEFVHAHRPQRGPKHSECGPEPAKGSKSKHAEHIDTAKPVLALSPRASGHPDSCTDRSAATQGRDPPPLASIQSQLMHGLKPPALFTPGQWSQEYEFVLSYVRSCSPCDGELVKVGSQIIVGSREALDQSVNGLHHWFPAVVTDVSYGIVDFRFLDPRFAGTYQLHAHSSLLAHIHKCRIVKSSFTAAELDDFNSTHSSDGRLGWKLLPTDSYDTNISDSQWVYTSCYANETFAIGGVAMCSEWEKGAFWAYKVGDPDAI